MLVGFHQWMFLKLCILLMCKAINGKIVSKVLLWLLWHGYGALSHLRKCAWTWCAGPCACMHNLLLWIQICIWLSNTRANFYMIWPMSLHGRLGQITSQHRSKYICFWSTLLHGRPGHICIEIVCCYAVFVVFLVEFKTKKVQLCLLC